MEILFFGGGFCADLPQRAQRARREILGLRPDQHGGPRRATEGKSRKDAAASVGLTSVPLEPFWLQTIRCGSLRVDGAGCRAANCSVCQFGGDPLNFPAAFSKQNGRTDMGAQ